VRKLRRQSFNGRLKGGMPQKARSSDSFCRRYKDIALQLAVKPTGYSLWSALHRRICSSEKGGTVAYLTRSEVSSKNGTPALNSSLITVAF
jgi:hypothetical protein